MSQSADSSFWLIVFILQYESNAHQSREWF
jgi:hypothetical protein